MISLGLSTANQKKFHALLGQNHHIAISLSLITLNHGFVSSLSTMFLGGQVTIDDSQDVSRSASLTFLDPQHKMDLDSNSPADGAYFIDRMIRIVYTVYSVDRSVWYSIPIFCGPITKMDRDWVVVNIECMGKEILALDQIWSPRTYKKGAKRTDVVKSMLQATGETKFSITKSNSKLTKNLALSSDHKPWTVARSIARTGGRQLFYDGRGVAVMRPYPTSTLFTFTEGAGGMILTKPQIGYDASMMINAVQVKGATPKGKKVPISYRATAAPGTPVYPYTIGRGGKPRFIPVYIDDDSIDTKAEAKEVALDRLKLGMYESTTAAFDSLPVPHLEPRDPYKISTAEVSVSAIVQQMTIPLQANETAAFGYLKSRKPNRTNIRRK